MSYICSNQDKKTKKCTCMANNACYQAECTPIEKRHPCIIHNGKLFCTIENCSHGNPRIVREIDFFEEEMRKIIE